jgi:hypothetical protein
MAASSVGNAMGWPNVGTAVARLDLFSLTTGNKNFVRRIFFFYDISKADSGIRFGILTGKYK